MKKFSLVCNKNKRKKRFKEIDRIRQQSFDSSERTKANLSLWLKKDGWDLSDFVTILKSLGLYKNLESIEEINNSAFFINTNSTTLRLLLKSGKQSSTITLEDSLSSRTYSVTRNYKNTPVLTLDKKTLFKPGKNLTCVYSKTSFFYSLITAEYSLDIELSKSLSEKAENYLLNLRPDEYVFDVSVVWDTIIQIDSLFNSPIHISCSKIVPDGVSKFTSRLQSDQNIIVYTLTKNDGAVISAFSSGDWEWTSPDEGIKIFYSKDDNNFKYVYEGPQSSIPDFSELLTPIKKEVEKMKMIFRE